MNIPRIYAYSDERFPGCLKVGYTTLTAEERVRQQTEAVKMPKQTWRIELDELAIRNDGTFFTDHEIHRGLQRMGVVREKGEWFRCTIGQLKKCITNEKTGQYDTDVNRYHSFPMRPEQQRAVDMTAAFFKNNPPTTGHTPHFLWNAKMRFGKTFAAYQLAKTMGWKHLLVITFKPAVASAWREDLLSHTDFKGWQFVSQSEGDTPPEKIDKQRPYVYFGSFQDLLGKDRATEGIKEQNQWIHQTHWDCVIFDEYHFGAWREKAQDLFGDSKTEIEKQLKKEYEDYQAEAKTIEKEEGNDISFVEDFDEEALPITTNHYLYLSGTPFRALQNGDFLEDQIFSWTYTDEQQAKEQWQGDNNPYLSLPQMQMMLYKLPKEVEEIAEKGEKDEFDLNLFFKAEGKGKNAKFKYETAVQGWLNFIRGQLSTTWENELKTDTPAPMPFAEVQLLNSLQHTFWFLPNVSACDAMENLLNAPANIFYQSYKIINCSGTKAGIGEKALENMRRQMGDPLHTQSITLSCGKLTTGVSVPAWSGIFVLRSLTSPETYFQSIFRVQTPWVLKNPDNTSPNREEIVKTQCYVFDFAPDRALKQIDQYCGQLTMNSEISREKSIEDFIHFLPVLYYDGAILEAINAQKILDIVIAGTTANQLVRRWESNLLVNVDTLTLSRLMNSPEAIAALENIEDFRSLRDDISTMINKSEKVKKAKKEAAEKGVKPDKEISEEEREYKSKRKEIQKRLRKLATRIPYFMYLTDYREETFYDVVRRSEPELFKSVTGLTQEQFELLANLGVFNKGLMNDAVYKFKRYEDSSLAYTEELTNKLNQ